MMSFKSRNRILIASLAFAGLQLLSGCFRPEPRVSDEELAKSATFYAEEVKGRSEISELHKGYSIPKSKLYSFTVCLRDRRTQEPVKGHKFSVRGGTQIVTSRTDNAGCLKWSETVNYEFLSDEKYVPLERVVQSEGIHKGARLMSLAINPWKRSEGSAEVIDLSRSNLPQESVLKPESVHPYLSGQSESGARELVPLWLTSLMIENKNVSKGGQHSHMTRDLDLSFSASVLVRDLQKRQVPFDLKSANLKVEAALIAAVIVGGEEKLFKAGPKINDVQVRREGDRFRAKVPVTVNYGNSNTRFQLALKLTPLNGPSKMQAFEGLFEIGGFDQLMGSGMLRAELKRSNSDLSSDAQGKVGSFSIDDQLAQLNDQLNGQSMDRSTGQSTDPSQPQGSSSPLPSGVTKAQAFKLSYIDVQILGVAGKETAMRRSVNYSVQVCITDLTNGGKPATDVDFKVKLANGIEKNLRTEARLNREGCLYWSDSIAHRFYEAEHYLLVPITISHANGFSESRKIALNPWDRFGMGRDYARDSEFVDSINSRPRPESRLIIDAVRTEAIEHRDYEIDRYLNLRTLKRVRMRMPLRVQRHSNILAGKSLPPEPLRDGVYLLKTALHLVSKDPTGAVIEMVAPARGGSRLVRVVGSEIKVDNEFAISDPRLMNARTSIVIEVLPIREQELTDEQVRTLSLGDRNPESFIDQDSKLVAPAFAGPLWIRDEHYFTTLIPTDELVASAAGKLPSSQGNSETFRAISYLAGTNVEKLTQKYLKTEKNYYNRMGREELLPEITRKLNVEYVSLNNSEVVFRSNPGLEKNNKIFSPTDGVERVLKNMNLPVFAKGYIYAEPFDQRRVQEKWTKNSLREIIEGPRELDGVVTARLCYLFLYEMHNQLFPEGILTYKLSPQKWAEECLKDLSTELTYRPRGSASQLFTLERKIRSFEIGPAKFRSGRSMHFKVGADVGFSRSKQESFNWGYGWSPMGMIDTAFGIAKSVGQLSLLSAGFNAIGISFDLKKNHTQNQSIGEGSIMAAGVELNMERVEINYDVKKYEKCAIIRLNPEFWNRRKNTLKRTINSEIDAFHMMTSLSRGIMLCKGMIESDPLIVTERYYSFGHGFADETQLDRGDLRNQPWLIMMRGERDYLTFVNFLEARKTDPSQVPDKISVGEVPLDRIEEAYRSFKLLSPAMPTLINNDPNTIRSARRNH